MFLAVAVIVAVSIIYLLVKKKVNYTLEQLALILILSGSLGNMLDRIRYNYVVDFIDIYVKNFHWYTFNIADSAICLAIILLLLPEKFRSKVSRI